MKHLHTEQGLHKVLQVIKHHQAKTTLGNLLTTAIQAYQIQASIPKHILEDTEYLPWLSNQWINNLHAFLSSTNGSIHLDDPWMIPKL